MYRISNVIKYILLVGIGLVLVSSELAFAETPSVSVFEPNYGEPIFQGSTYDVIIKTNGVLQRTIYVRLYRNDVFVQDIGTDYVITSPYNVLIKWVVPLNLQVGGGYKVRAGITSDTERETYDLSDTSFSILSSQKSVLMASSTVPSPIIVSSGTISITSCGEIIRNGNYILDQDIISSSNLNCLNVHDVDNVHIQCKNHKIIGNAAVFFNNINNFSLKSCILDTLDSSYTTSLKIDNSNYGTVSDNFIGKMHASLINTSNLLVENNRFNMAYWQDYSSYNVINNNIFGLSAVPLQVNGNIELKRGSNNKITNNIIDGKSDAIFNNRIGADDGIVLGDETYDIVQDNNIKNVWDCGIETIDTVSQTKFINNVIKNAGFCGIGAWYRNNWKENVVIGNRIDMAPNLFKFFREFDPGIKDESIYFSDNSFENNILGTRTITGGVNDQTMLSFTKGEKGGSSVPKNLIAKNNKFTNNDFNKDAPAPIFEPTSIIIDGGGNVCRISQGSPLQCGKQDNVSISVQSSSAALLTSKPPFYSWNRNLYLGLKNNPDVRALQQILKMEGVYYGPITGNFGSLTRKAVIAFQKKYKFTSIPNSGYVGPYTRKVLNGLYSK